MNHNSLGIIFQSVSFWACGFGKRHDINHSDMNFLAKNYLEIGYALLSLAVAMLVGAIKIAFDLFIEYRATKQALKELAER